MHVYNIRIMHKKFKRAAKILFLYNYTDDINTFTQPTHSHASMNTLVHELTYKLNRRHSIKWPSLNSLYALSVTSHSHRSRPSYQTPQRKP